MLVSFVGAVWLDPLQPVRSAAFGYVVLAMYSAWSLVLVAVAIRDWWTDFVVSRWAHAIDIGVWLVSVYFTDNAMTDLSSPFLAFFVYLLIAANIRWGWRRAMQTGLAAVTGYLAIATAIMVLQIDIDIIRVARKVSYMLILTALIVWFGARRASIRIPPLKFSPNALRNLSRFPLEEALDFACTTTNAGRAALVWSPSDEPWSELHLHDRGAHSRRRMSQDEWGASDAPANPILVDLRRGVALIGSSDFDVERATVAPAVQLAHLVAIEEGVIVSLHTDFGSGQLLMSDIPAMGLDDLPLAAAIAREVETGLDRHALSGFALDAELGRVRQAIGRDLHDSVAQSLSGAVFRLQALRANVNDPSRVEEELHSIQEALRSEQRQLRAIIARLRSGEEVSRSHDLGADLAELLAEAGMHWRIDTQLEAGTARVIVPTRMLHEIRQIVREAVANAVRHGRCSKVRVMLSGAAAGFHLDVFDDGVGVDSSERRLARPRSITERVEALGGSLEIRSGPAGTRLHIALPERLAA